MHTGTRGRETASGVISCGLHHIYMLAHILQLPKKGVADLCLCLLATYTM